MLDVHPPHEKTHTWTDFFIHIATICVGLLIAIGLEQTVEWLHHRHQVAVTRNELSRERELNRQRFVLVREELDRWTHTLTNDAETLTYLRAHPHAPPESWPHPFQFGGAIVPYTDTVWKTAQLSGVLEYMPHREVKQYNELYARMAAVTAAQEALRAPIFRLRGTYIDGPVQDQTPQQLETAWQNLKDLRIQVAAIFQMQHNIFARYPDFPSDANVFGDRHLLLGEPVANELASPWQKTIDRLNALDAADDNEQ